MEELENRSILKEYQEKTKKNEECKETESNNGFCKQEKLHIELVLKGSTQVVKDLWRTSSQGPHKKITEITCRSFTLQNGIERLSSHISDKEKFFDPMKKHMLKVCLESRSPEICNGLQRNYYSPCYEERIRADREVLDMLNKEKLQNENDGMK